MYSRNDYRYYLEHRLEKSNDFLAHYGVKGMRKGQHLPQVLAKLRAQANLKQRFNDNYRTYSSSGQFESDGGYKWKERGIESKKAYKYISIGSRKYKNGTRTKDLYFTPTKKPHYKRIGRLRLSSGEEGSRISLDVSSKKRYQKNNRREAASIARQGQFSVPYIAKDAVEATQKKRKKK